jgi:hypothetical protein
MKAVILRGVALIFAAASLAACGLPPMVSDTGYRGTWSRGNEHNTSFVAIAEVGGRWYFRWTKRSHDGKHSVLCGWDGRCTERLDGNQIALYTIVTRYDPASGTLATDTVEERTAPVQQTFRYTDVMSVTDGGLTLWNYTTDRDGQHYEGKARPRRSFSKVANSVADPPRPERP